MRTTRWLATATMAAALAGCADAASPGSPALAGGGGDCASMKAQMDRMGAQGKSGTKEYKAILDSYLYKNCYR